MGHCFTSTLTGGFFVLLLLAVIPIASLVLAQDAPPPAEPSPVAPIVIPTTTPSIPVIQIMGMTTTQEGLTGTQVGLTNTVLPTVTYTFPTETAVEPDEIEVPIIIPPLSPTDQIIPPTPITPIVIPTNTVPPMVTPLPSYTPVQEPELIAPPAVQGSQTGSCDFDYAIVTTLAEFEAAIDCANTGGVADPYPIFIAENTPTFNLTQTIFINANVQIYGRGIGQSVFDGSNVNQAFNIQNNSVVKFSHLTIRDVGNAQNRVAYGGAMTIGRINTTVEILDSELANNEAQFGGGALNNGDNVIIARSRFIGNTAGGGAAIQSYAPNLNITCSLFEGNDNYTGSDYAAAILNDDGGSVTISQSSFLNNVTNELWNRSTNSFNANNNWWNGRTPSNLVANDMGASAITVNSPLTSNPVTTDPACAPTTPEPIPIPPVANAGPDQTVTDTDSNGFETVQLDGSQSTADGGITEYRWMVISSTGQDLGEIYYGAQPSATLDVGNHLLSLTITDAVGARSVDYVTIIVEEAVQPSFTNLDFSGEHRGLKAVMFWGIYHELSEDVYFSGSALDSIVDPTVAQFTAFLHTSPHCVIGSNEFNNAIVAETTDLASYNWGIKHCPEDHRYVSAHLMLNGFLNYERRGAPPLNYATRNWFSALSYSSTKYTVDACQVQSVPIEYESTQEIQVTNKTTPGLVTRLVADQTEYVQMEWLHNYLQCLVILDASSLDPNNRIFVERIQYVYQNTIGPQIDLAVQDFLTNPSNDPAFGGFEHKHASQTTNLQGNDIQGVYQTCVGGCTVGGYEDTVTSYFQPTSRVPGLGFVSFAEPASQITLTDILEAYDDHIAFVDQYRPAQQSVAQPYLQRARDGSGYQWITAIYQQTGNMSHCPRINSPGTQCPW